MQMEQEQKQKEQELEKLTVELQLSKQRTEEARKIAELNKSQAEAAEQNLDEQDNDTIRDFLNSRRAKESLRLPPEDISNERKTAPIRLKGVDLPKFAGEDKSDYESWKAAFMSVVYRLHIPVGEKCFGC